MLIIGWVLGHNINTGRTGIFPNECISSVNYADPSIPLKCPNSADSMEITPKRMVLQEIGKTKKKDHEFWLASTKGRFAIIVASTCSILTIIAVGLQYGNAA